MGLCLEMNRVAFDSENNEHVLAGLVSIASGLT
jgi:hypothetical protein